MAKIGRNEPCHCGSGRKYKHCCLEADQASAAAEREAEREAEAASQAALEDDAPLFGEDDRDSGEGLFNGPDMSTAGLPAVPAGSAKLARLVPPEIDIEHQEKELDRIGLQLKPYLETFGALDDDDGLVARTLALFDEPRFAGMRFTAEDLMPYFEVFCCPFNPGDDALAECSADLVDVLFAKGDEPKLLFYLLSQLPEMLSAGRHLDAYIIHRSAMLIHDAPEDDMSPFLIHMVSYGLREWLAARAVERAEVRDRFGIDLDTELHVGSDAVLDTRARSADGGAPLTLRDYLAGHRQLEHWLEARDDEADTAAMAMLKREEPEVLFLRDDEIAPWRSMLADLIIEARELGTGRKRRRARGDSMEFLLDAFAEASSAMAAEILVGERLEELRRAIAALGCELEAAGRSDALGIMGALMAASEPPAERESQFMDLLCFLSLQRHVRGDRGAAPDGVARPSRGRTKQ